MSAKRKKKPAVSLAKANIATHRKEGAAFKKTVLKHLKLAMHAPEKYSMFVSLKHTKEKGKLNSIVIHYPPSSGF
jgi:hypothetical protein